MAVFKCKMCGGTIEFEQGASVGVCDSCGTRQTLPRLDDDKKANLYDRANHFRRNNDFDKAMGIYEQILNEDNTDAEAYWSLVLCRYGIEYVEDPQSHRRIPTVNRAQYTSIFADADYKSAIQYADGAQRIIYEQEAKAIDDIQKGILEISAKEEPFDIFICYKETDANGRRTQDSVLANDLYHQLTAEGFKVFFSRITLEDKLGIAYEPYIFAALNSAKVMVVLGTKPEYFNAVWVKNEWSRYLALVKNSGCRKMLIPAYRDMDPYDLPEEFSHLQAQDMSKLGFMQDLIRGIQKIISADAPKTAAKETVIVGANSAAVAPLLERVFLFLEDGKWRDADIYCEKVLDIDPKNADAYLGKLMAELQVKNRKQLADCPLPFDDHDNYRKVIRFGGDKLEAEMRGYIAHINDRNENARLNGIYNTALNTMRTANTRSAFEEAANQFRSISGFQDADALAEQCLTKAEVCRKNSIYTIAKLKMADGRTRGYEEAIQVFGKSKVASKRIQDLEAAIQTFQTIADWRDADEQILACKKAIEEIKIQQEADRLQAERETEERRIAAEKAAKRRKKALAIGIPIACVCVAFLIVLATVIIPKEKYNKAMRLIDAGDYEPAYALLEEIGNSEAIASNKYDRAMELIDSGDYEPAYMLLDGLEYKDSNAKLQSIHAEYEVTQLAKANVGDIVVFGAYEQDNDTSNGKEEIEWRVLAKENNKVLVISEKALDCQPYNSSYTDITWESCTLRKWLNGTFLNAAFSAEEQAIIQSENVPADRNPEYSTDSGKATTDKAFLLSIDEAEKYFASDDARQCQTTAYAVENRAYENDSGNCWWWLRSPGYDRDSAACVRSDGSVHYSGHSVGEDYDCVRPALWINLES